MRLFRVHPRSGMPSPLLVGGALLLACSAAGEGAGRDGGTHPRSPRRASNTTCHALPAPSPAARFAFVPVFTHAYPRRGHSSVPTQLVHTPEPGADHWLLSLQTGQVLRFSGDEAAPSTVVLDIADRMPEVSPGGSAGLLSLALHPRFPENGHAFVVYTAKGDDDDDPVSSRLARFTLGADGRFDPDSELVLTEERQPNVLHTGNHVAFGPDDGYLYFSIGDGRRPRVHPQDPHTRQGALLRIDVDSNGPAGDPAYRIPPGNPFADGVKGAPEVYAYGLRNPWRFVFDHDGRLLLGDVGESSVEELNLVQGGENFGWPLREGTRCTDPTACPGEGLTPPILELRHPEHRSITPGFTYTRDDLPGLRGRFLLSDFQSGSLYSVDLSDPTLAVRRELAGTFLLVSITRGPEGRLYALRYDLEGSGQVLRLEAAPGTSEVPGEPFPERLSQTGCVDPEDPRKPAPGLVPYRPRAELWSDGAEKTRFLALPDDQRLSPGDGGELELPPGTVLVKHFGFRGRRHEARLLMRADEGWHGVSYAWNDEQTDAVLLADGADVTLPNGLRWTYPSRRDCRTCHTRAAGVSLGLEAAQLDWRWPDGPGGGTVTQLAWLLAHDYFPEDVLAVDTIRDGAAALPDPRDADGAPPADRVAAYLHANCAGCHRPGGPTPVAIDLRYGTPFSEQGLCDVEPLGRVWGLEVWDEQRIVAPGAPGRSTLWVRLGRRGMFQMPPLARGTVDQEMTALVADWIRGLDGC